MYIFYELTSSAVCGSARFPVQWDNLKSAAFLGEGGRS